MMSRLGLLLLCLSAGKGADYFFAVEDVATDTFKYGPNVCVSDVGS